ncbi:MAG: tryptophan 7-halogenase [Pseudomonadota bacterium]
MKLKRVVIVGSGIAPAIAGAALRSAFGRAGLEVEWIETPGAISPHQVVPGLPNARGFHRLLGVDQPEILHRRRATFTLGQQYLGFSGGEGEFLHSYGPIGRPVGSLPFIQFWIKAKQAGLPAKFEDFAREAVAARNGRLRLADTRDMPATAHGYHLDARDYAEVLRAQALWSGVTVTPDAAPVAAVEDGRVSSLTLSDGRRIEADLFVDTSGAIRAALGSDDIADASISGCTRLVLASGKAMRPLPLYSRVAAHRAGWSALYPLQDRTGIVIAYDAAAIGDEEAATLAGMPLDGEPEFMPLAPWQRTRPWAGNVVAIGDAADEGEPLAATALHRLQIAVTHLISLFPVDRHAMPEAGIYNEELAAYHARLLDFEAAHYALNQRDEPFWAAARARPRSPELDAKIGLFGARGMIAQYNQESFAEDEWQAAFLGHGLMPRSYDPQADRVDEQQVMLAFRDQLAAIRADVTAMDTHEAAIAKAMVH